jgi:glycosyltransferase involved in cell wall biosynthesis
MTFTLPEQHAHGTGSEILRVKAPAQPAPEPAAEEPIWSGYRVAAIVPCHNEALSIGRVVTDLKSHVPGIVVYVYDNCSTDETAAVAREAGAIVRHESLKGKGNVVRRAFADIDADIYLMIDGDDTSDAAAAPEMISALIQGHHDHVLGMRAPVEDGAYRPNHEWGNKVLNSVVGTVFGTNVGDMLSGYRVFSRRFVKSFPAVSREFEIETELTVHTLSLRTPTVSLPVGFKDRCEGSESKLNTYRDGFKILKLIAGLARHERPLAFYGLLATISMVLSLLFAAPVLVEYFSSGMVPRFPTLAVSIGLGVIAFLSMFAGLILDGIRKTRHELSRLSYLQHRAVNPA